MSYFANILSSLENLGLLDVILPFMLIFTISFAVLQKSKILGKDSKNFNTIISFVLALAVIVPHVMGYYPGGADVVVIINSALPNVSLLMIASMMALLLIGVFGGEVNILGSPLEGIVVLFAVIAVAWTFLSSAGIVNEISFLSDPETKSLLIAILVFGIIVWFITKEENPERDHTHKALDKAFGGWLGKGGDHH